MLGLALQIIACAVTLIATWQIGNKRVSGPALNVVAALCFTVVNVYAGLWLCAAFSATMATMNARNVMRWREERGA